MEDIFIQSILIKKVRHLENILIDLDADTRKHLILTGKNGSGKTSVLDVIGANLDDLAKGKENVVDLILQIKKHKQNLGIWEKQLVVNPKANTLKKRIVHIQNLINKTEEKLKTFKQGIALEFNTDTEIGRFFQHGEFLFAHFNTQRLTNITIPTGIKKMNLKDVYNISEKINTNFIQYIVNLKAEKSFARDDGDMETAQKIDKWFDNFEKGLREIFDDADLKLVFDRKEYNFYFQLGNGNQVTINQLSDGYAAILSIITELMLRMEKKNPIHYDMQGVVLIDEIDAHLHLELQKKILPFLSTFFPRIQFIVTTHSPFVISSDENCVIYDLEKNIRVEDATSYSYDTIVESYFDTDKYSTKVKMKLAEYEQLFLSHQLSTKEKERLHYLERYFQNAPKERAEITALKDEPKVNRTVELLEKVYNGHTPLKIIEAGKLRQILLESIRDFQRLLFDYFDEKLEFKKPETTQKIAYELSNASSFTAFKRWIIRDNPSLFKEFSDLMY